MVDLSNKCNVWGVKGHAMRCRAVILNRILRVKQTMHALRVGIIGTGCVGSALGGQLCKNKSFSVKYGTRHPGSDKTLERLLPILESQPGTSADGVQHTIDWADAVILAIPMPHEDDDIKATAANLGPGVKGKVLIDVTNPLTPFPDLQSRWEFGGKSGGELLAEALPDTHVFKAFNTIGFHHMQAPDGGLITGQQLTMLYAGPPEARAIAEQIVAGVGFAPAYVGPIRYARNLEAIAELWIHLKGIPGVGTAEDWGPNFHFQVIRGPTK